ncbi:MAG TPA: DinB family protein, partial [Vicinamibacterales bacterium]
MKIIDGLLAELEQEAEATRRVLERIPQAHLSWKPHPKSMSLGQLALHVATVPGSVAELAAADLVPEPPAFVQPEAASTSELLPSLKE